MRLGGKMLLICTLFAIIDLQQMVRFLSIQVSAPFPLLFAVRNTVRWKEEVLWQKPVRTFTNEKTDVGKADLSVQGNRTEKQNMLLSMPEPIPRSRQSWKNVNELL